MRSRFPFHRAVVAIFLVALVASPFTAPFKTWDLAAPIGDQPLDDPLSGEKLSKDAGLLPPVAQLVLVGVAAVRYPGLSVRTVTSPRLRSVVLRL